MEHQQHTAHGQQQGCAAQRQAVAQVAPWPQGAHRAREQPPQRRPRQQQQGHGHAPVEQVGGFAGVGLQHVHQHGRINHDAVAGHEIRPAGTRQQRHNEHGLEQPAPGEQAEHQRIACRHQHGEGQAKPPAAQAADFWQLGQFQPQRQVAKHCQPQADACYQQCRMACCGSKRGAGGRWQGRAGKRRAQALQGSEHG